MIEGKVPQDITIYKTKVMGNFSLRQAVCIVIAGGVDIALFLLLKTIGVSIEVFIVVGLCIDVLIMMFSVKHQGMYMEVWIKEVLVWNIKTSNIRLPGKEYASNSKKKDRKNNEISRKKMKELQKIHPEYIPYK